MELTKAERRIIGRKATKRIVSKIGKLKKKEAQCLTLQEAYSMMIDQWYSMLDKLNGGSK